MSLALLALALALAYALTLTLALAFALTHLTQYRCHTESVHSSFGRQNHHGQTHTNLSKHSHSVGRSTFSICTHSPIAHTSSSVMACAITIPRLPSPPARTHKDCAHPALRHAPAAQTARGRGPIISPLLTILTADAEVALDLVRCSGTDRDRPALASDAVSRRANMMHEGSWIFQVRVAISTRTLLDHIDAPRARNPYQVQPYSRIDPYENMASACLYFFYCLDLILHV